MRDVFGAVALAVGLGLAMMAPASATDANPKVIHYRNGRWDFRLAYPTGWKADSGEDGAGILLTRDGQAMAVGALYAGENEDGKPTLSCVDAKSDPLISRGQPAAGSKLLLGRRAIRFRGFPACWRRLGFSLNGKKYEGDYFSLLRHGLQYDFSMECPDKDCRIARERYRQLLASFRFGNDRQ